MRYLFILLVIFTSCKKSTESDPLLNQRQCVIGAFGVNSFVYINNNLLAKEKYVNYPSYNQVNVGDVIHLVVDSSAYGTNITGGSGVIKIVDGHYKCLFQNSYSATYNLDVTYLVK